MGKKGEEKGMLVAGYFGISTYIKRKRQNGKDRENKDEDKQETYGLVLPFYFLN